MKQLLLLVAMLLAATPALAQKTSPDAINGCIYNSTSPTLATGQPTVFQCDVNGNLKTTGGGGGGGTTVLGTSTAAIGEVGGFNFVKATTPTVSTSAYSTGQSIGGLQTISIFRTTANPHAVLDNAQLASKGGSTTALTLYLFTASPASTCTNQNTFSFAAADAAFLVPGYPIVLTPAVIGAGTTASFAQQFGPWSAQNQDGTVNTNLYACLVAGAAVTPTSTSDLVLSFGGIND